MAAAYSMDLRTRVLKDSDAGLSSKELAERYHVSRAWVDALKQRRRETGAFAPFRPTKFRGRSGFLSGFIREKGIREPELGWPLFRKQSNEWMAGSGLNLNPTRGAGFGSSYPQRYGSRGRGSAMRKSSASWRQRTRNEKFRIRLP